MDMIFRSTNTQNLTSCSIDEFSNVLMYTVNMFLANCRTIHLCMEDYMDINFC